MKMAELRDLCPRLGFTQVETYLQSGNLIVSTPSGDEEVRTRLVQGICDAFGYTDVSVLVRTAEQLNAVVRGNPFLGGDRDITKLHATFLARRPEPDALGHVDADRFLPDEFSLQSAVVYVHCPNGYGRTKLHNKFFERKLGMQATTRNWKTVLALLERATP